MPTNLKNRSPAAVDLATNTLVAVEQHTDENEHSLPRINCHNLNMPSEDGPEVDDQATVQTAAGSLAHILQDVNMFPEEEVYGAGNIKIMSSRYVNQGMELDNDKGLILCVLQK